MGIVDSIVGFIGTWFGYVGTCVVSPVPTCRPFLAFVALGSSASVFLILLLKTYKSLHEKELREIEARRAQARSANARARPPSAPAQKDLAARRRLTHGAHMAA